ncbi:MAG: helix-turn-helix transcriptional regulator [Pseudomonadota bacterium]
MQEIRQLVSSLKRIMRSRGITYASLAQALGISEASVKRTFSQRTFTLDRLAKICEVLDLSIYELARTARLAEDDLPKELSAEQENALAADPLLLAYFYLLINGWRPARIAGHFKMPRPRHTKLLIRLDRLALIRLLPGNQVVLVTSRTIEWRPDGPVRALYESLVLREFLNFSFDKPTERYRFASAELSSASAQLLARKVDRLVREFDEMAELDLTLPASKKTGVGLLIGQRPWAFWSVLAAVGADEVAVGGPSYSQ